MNNTIVKLMTTTGIILASTLISLCVITLIVGAVTNFNFVVV